MGPRGEIDCKNLAYPDLSMNDAPVAAMHTLWIRVESDMPWHIPFSSHDVYGLISGCKSDWRLAPRLDGIAGCRLMLTTANEVELKRYGMTIDTLLREHPTAGSTPSNALRLRIL